MSLWKRFIATGVGVVSLAVICSPSAEAAALRYGSFSVPNTKVDTVNVQYHILERSASFSCSLSVLSCVPKDPNAPQHIPPELQERDYVMSLRGDLVLTRDPGTNAATEVNTLYHILAGDHLDQGVVLAVTSPVRRAYFADGADRVLLATGGKLVLIDWAKNEIVNTVPFDIGSGISFTTLSPRGRFFAFYDYGTEKEPERGHGVIDLETGKIYKTAEKLAYWDLLTEENRVFQFSPDDKYLIYLDDAAGQPTLYRVDLASIKGAKLGGTRIFSRNYTVADFLVWDANTIFYIANREGPLDWRLYRYDLKTKKLTQVANNASYGSLIKRAGNYLVFSRLDDQGSTVIFYDAKDGSTAPVPVPQEWASSNPPPGVATKPGGRLMVLAKPDDYSASKTYPVIVWLHGGPYRETSLGYHPYASYGVYDWMLEQLRESGYVIAKLDYTGSYGYGRKYAEALKGQVGKKDVADVLADVAGLKKSVRTSEIYLMGVSYGGYLGLRTLVESPSKFSGAISINGVTDWEAIIAQIPDSIFATHFMGPPDSTNRALYDKASVINRIPNLTTQNIFIVQSEDDTSVPPTQGPLLRDILIANKKNVVFQAYPGENHVFENSKSVEDVCSRVLGFVGVSTANRCKLF